jgi:hypothetical protein
MGALLVAMQGVKRLLGVAQDADAPRSSAVKSDN